MATHDDFSYVVDLSARLPGALREAQVRGARAVATHIAKGITTEIKGATGGDMRLSGARNAKIAVVRKNDLGGATPKVTLFPTGPLMLVEENTPPHRIAPRRRGGKRAIKFNGRFAAHARHPGTTGKHPWRRGVNRGEQGAGRIYAAEVTKAVGKAL